jgi:hypothetical protein
LGLSNNKKGELITPWVPSPLTIAAVDNTTYAVKDEYNSVAVVLPVMMLARWVFNPHYLYLDSCSVFNKVVTKDHINDLRRVKIALRRGYTAGTSTSYMVC